MGLHERSAPIHHGCVNIEPCRVRHAATFSNLHTDLTGKTNNLTHKSTRDEECELINTEITAAATALTFSGD